MNTDADIGDAEMWTILLASPECTDKERAAFEVWLASSAEHPVRYSQAQHIHMLTRELAGDELLMAEVRRARRANPMLNRPLVRWASIGLAATLAVALAVPAWLKRTADDHVQIQRYVAAVGEQRKIRLSDGTFVVLDTQSEITTRFDSDERRIQLVQGQAQFIAGQDQRPLTIYSDEVQIRDIGTTFQVRNVERQISVVLISGAVSIKNKKSPSIASDTMLRPGQKLTFDNSSGAPTISNVDISQVDAWTEGALYVQEQRLDLVLNEINRYSKRKIRLANPADGEILISGKYKATDQDALLRSLSAGWALHVQSGTANEVILAR